MLQYSYLLLLNIIKNQINIFYEQKKMKVDASIHRLGLIILPFGIMYGPADKKVCKKGKMVWVNWNEPFSKEIIVFLQMIILKNKSFFNI